MDHTTARLPRRRALSKGLAAAGACLAAPLLVGCKAGSMVAQLQQTFTPPTLTVFLLNGASGNGGDLRDLAKPLQVALAVAAKHVSGLGGVTFQTGNDTTSWFPLPKTLFNFGADPAARVDDPNIPMPDVVVAIHSQMPDYLANRALDLQPTIKLQSAVLQGLAANALRLGRAYGHGAGTFQAGIPILRIPLLCAVQPGITAVKGGKAWTADQFLHTLAGLATAYGPPNAPVTPIPYASGLMEMAAVGSGGTLAVSTAATCQATFGDGASAQGLAALVQWAQYAPQEQVFRAPDFQYAVLLIDGGTILASGGAPVRFGRNAKGPDPKGWTVAPVPNFPTRTATPVRSIDAMVFKHTKSPTVAASLALALASADAQAALLAYQGALSIRTDQATRQLTRTLTNVQGPDLIASGAHDIIDDDAYGVLTDQNDAARTIVRNDLLGAIHSLVGDNAGQFFTFGDFNGPGFNFNQPFASLSAPAGATTASVLSAAEAAANALAPYPA